MWPSAVPTSVTRVTISLLRGRHRVLRGLDVGVDLAVAGVQRTVLQPVLDLLEALDHLAGQVAGALRDLLPGEGQQQRDDGDAADHHEQGGEARAAAAAAPAGRPSARPARRAAARSPAAAPRPRTSRCPRQDVAGGHDDQQPPRPGRGEVDAVGHLAAVVVGLPGLDADRLARRGARRASWPTAARSRSANRSSDRRCWPRRSFDRPRRHSLRDPAADAHGPQAMSRLRRLPVAGAPAARAPRPGGSGEQARSGQHVVVVDDDPRRRGSCQPPSTGSPVADGEHPRGEGGAVARSTPPEPTSRSTSRRSLPVRSTTRPSGPTTTCCGRRAGAAPARPRRWRAARRRRLVRSVGRKAGSSCRRLGGGAQPRAVREDPGGHPLGDRGHRGPAHPEVALDGAGDRRGRDDLAGQAGVLGVELDHGVHVGGGAADVDHHDVAGARVLGVEAAGQQLDAGEHHVGRRAADHRREVGARAEVLAADHVGAGTSPGSPRGPSPGRARRSGAPRCRRARAASRPPSIAATSAWASTLPATTTGPAQPAGQAAGARRASTSALPPSVPPVSSTTSGRLVRRARRRSPA